MPRVHGINIVPRRGRGRGRGRSRPSAAFGGGGGVAVVAGGAGHDTTEPAASAPADDGSSAPNFEEAKEQSTSPSGDCVKDLEGGNLCMSLDMDPATGKNDSSDLKSAPATTASPMASSPASSLTMLTSNKAKAQTSSATKSIDDSNADSAKATSSTITTGMNIQPQSRECLNHLEFGSHSFSVQEISHKSPPKSKPLDSMQFNSVGLAPSLETSSEVPATGLETTEQMMTSREQDGKMMPPLETNANVTVEDQKEASSTPQKPMEESNIASETAQMMANGMRISDVAEEKNGNVLKEKLPSPEGPNEASESMQQSSKKENDNDAAVDAVDDNSSNNANAFWLYFLCSSACIQMETTISPLDLAVQTLQAIRSIEDEDALEEQLQTKLFEVLKVGKRRDLDFVFDVSEKASELREDEMLNEKSLQNVAAVVSGTKIEVDDDHVEMDDHSDDIPVGSHEIHPMQSTDEFAAKNADTDVPKKMQSMATPQFSHHEKHQKAPNYCASEDGSPERKYRSRRKKRPTQHTTAISDNSTQQMVGNEMNANDSPTLGTSTDHANDADKETAHADFPIMKDGLDMQDDDLHFLQSAQLPSIDEKDDDEVQTRRVTRSMGLDYNDDEDDAEGDSCNAEDKLTVENSVENGEKEDGNMGKDENADTAESACSTNDKHVETAARGNTMQDESLKPDCKTGVVDDKKSEHHGERAIESQNEAETCHKPVDLEEDQHCNDEEARSMNIGKADEAENAEECIEREDETIHTYETAAAVGNKSCEDAGSAEDKPIEKSVGSNEEQNEMPRVDTVTDAIKSVSEEEVITNNTASGNENQCEETNTYDNSSPRCSDLSHSEDNGEVYTAVKTRKRGECKDTVKIVFTGITVTQRHRQMIETIGAQFIDSIEEAHTATHVIVSDGKTKLRRTPKLMICMCKVSRILTMDWLEQSAREQRVLGTDEYLLLGDKEAEKRYNFSMKETIRNGILARKKRGGVLGGWSVFICSGVAGNKAPNMKELNLIIEAAGGNVLKSLSNSDAFDPTETFVLTSEPRSPSQLKERGVSRAERQGARLLSTQNLFHIVITQSLSGIDIYDDTKNDELHGSPLLRRDSMGSLSSTLGVMSASPLKRSRKRIPSQVGSHISDQAIDARSNDDISDKSSTSAQGFRVHNINRASPPPESELKRRRLNFCESKPASTQKCFKYTTRDQFLSSNQSMMSSIDAFSAADDICAAQTHGLWLDYFNEVSKVSPVSSKSSKNMSSSNSSKKSAKRPKKGVRCLRGRKRSISPMVSSTTQTGMTSTKSSRPKPSISATTRKILIEDNPYVTWEAYVLFSLAARAEKIGFHESSVSNRIMSANDYFPRPIAINSDGSIDQQKNDHVPALSSASKRLSLTVHSTDSRDNDHRANEAFEVFGTLQDVFSLHQQSQSSGMISERILSMLSLQAIEAVAVMHTCGVIHNDIGLDSFLVVRRVPASGKKTRQHLTNDGDDWFLQMNGFGYKSVLLNCQQQCQESHYEHDYQCLGNVIHLLLTGGVEIAMNKTASGSVEFATKVFIKGNLFLRGALSWCSLIDALMCAGELSPTRNMSGDPFVIQHPFNVVDLTSSDDDDDRRMHQFGWSCRILQELSEDNGLSDFMDGLCSHNSRFIFPETNLRAFSCIELDSRHSFSCYLSSERTVEHLMQKESKLQVDTTALEQREKELQEKIDKFEQSEAEHQALLERAREIRVKENELLQREREHALEVQRLERMKEDLLLRESRLEQRLQSLKRAPNSSTSPLRPLPQQGHVVHSPAINREKAFTSSKKQSSHQKKNSKVKNLPTPSNSQLLAGETTSQVLNASPSYKELSAIPRENLDTYISPRNTIRYKRKSSALKPNSPDSSNDADCSSQYDFQGESQDSQESASSLKKRKKGTGRKSPKCSLHNLPKSPKKKPPKKVFINLDED